MLQQTGLLLLLHSLGLCGQMLVTEADVCPTLTAQWGSGGVTTCWDTIRHPLSILWPSQSIRVYPWHVHPMLSDS